MKNSIDSRERSALYCTLADRAFSLSIKIYYSSLYETKIVDCVDERRFEANDRSKVSCKNIGAYSKEISFEFKLLLTV